MADTPTHAADLPVSPPPPPRRRRRRWLRALVAIVVVVVLLVLLAPTLLSTPPARSLVVGIVNGRLNGRVEVGSWSLGWFTGIEADNIQVLDAQKSPVAELRRFSTQLTLLKAITGRYALGKTTIDGLRLHARMGSDGVWNFSTLSKPAESSVPQNRNPTNGSAPSKLPNLSGEIILSDAQATVEQPGKPTMSVPQLSADVNIPDINGTITDQLNAAVQVGSAVPGALAVTGTAAVFKGNQFASDSANVHQQVDLSSLELQALLPLLPPTVGISRAQGTAEAHATLDVAGGKTLTASLTLTGKSIALAGPALKGDTYTTQALSLNIPRLAGAFPNGLDAWQSGRVQMGSGAGSAPLAFTFDQGSITASVDAVPQALLNVSQNKKPGDVGSVGIAARVDLAKLAAVLKNSLQLAPGLNLTSGTIKHITTLTTDVQKATLASATDITNLAGTRTDPGQRARPVALHQPIHLDLSAGDFGGGGAIPDLRDLHLNLSSSFASGGFQGASLAGIQGQLIGHFRQVQAELGQFVQMNPQPLGGDFSVMVNSRGDLATPGSTATLTAVASVNQFTRGSETNLPWAALTLSGDLHRGGGDLFIDSLQNGSMSLQSGNPQSPTVDCSATADADFASAPTATPPSPGVLTAVKDAALSLTAPSLPALQQLANAFSPPPATAVSPATPDAAPPLTLTGGTLTLHADLSHQGSTLLANVSDLAASNVAFTCGAGSYMMKPVHVQLAVAMEPASTAAGASAAMLAPIHQVRVTKLVGDLGVATLSMPTPITLTDLASSAPTATGTVQLEAKLEEVGPLLAALQGEPASAFPYAGNLTTTQAVQSEQGTLGLDGSLRIDKFQVLKTASAPGAPTTAPAVAFSEDQISVADRLELRNQLNSVTIENLAVAMQSSKAMALSIENGTVDDLTGARRIALTANINYDLAKLWPIVHPMLTTPGKEDAYADVQAGGAFQKTFRITGAYPADLPFQQAIAQLEINGDVAVGSFSHSGLAVSNLDVPVTMGHGMFATIFPGKPAGQNTAPPATANSGQLDLGNLFVDLTKSPPRLSSATPAMAVLKNVTVNPLFSRTYLAKLINNPVFAGAQQASGLFTLYLDRCVNLPMGELITERTAANDGQANLRFSLTNLNIGLQGIGAIASAMKQDSFTANVNDGTVAIAGGFATQHMVFNTGTYNISFDGKVALDTEQLMPLTITLPGNRIARAVTSDPNVLKYVPSEVAVVMTGTVDHPQVQMDQVLQKLLAGTAQKAALGNVADFLTGKGGDGTGAAAGRSGGGDGSATSQPAGSEQDALGALIDGFQKKKKKH